LLADPGKAAKKTKKGKSAEKQLAKSKEADPDKMDYLEIPGEPEY
jgi:hypothetical protein